MNNLVINLSDDPETSFVTVSILIPDDYPSTLFSEECRKHHDGCFGKLRASVGDTVWMNANFPANKFYFPWKSSTDLSNIRVFFIFIILVYGYTSSLATTQEKQMLRGYGRKMVKVLLDYVGNDDPTYFALEASGSVSANQEIYVNQYTSLGEKDLLWELFRRFPYELRDSIYFYDEEPVRETLLEILVNCCVCSELISHYQKKYNFGLWQIGHSNGALMGCSYDELLMAINS